MVQTNGYVKKLTWTPSALSVAIGQSQGTAESFSITYQPTDTEVDLATKRNMANLLVRARGVGCRIVVRHPDNSNDIQAVTFDSLIDPAELRNNVVIATQTYNAAFGCPQNRCSEQNLGVNLNEKQVNQFFTGPPPWTTDCLGAALIIEARGLILSLRPGEFDALSYTTGKVVWDSPTTWHIDTYPMRLIGRPVVNEGDMLIGEWAYFKNDPRYLDYYPMGGYQGENVIKVSETEYYGFPTKQPQTAQEWLQELINAFNIYLPPGVPKITSVPGFIGAVNRGFDVNAISLDLLKLRYP